MEYTKKLGRGISITRVYKDTPREFFERLGKQIETKKRLESLNVGVPKYSKAQKKKTKKDMKNYFNSLEQKYGK